MLMSLFCFFLVPQGITSSAGCFGGAAGIWIELTGGTLTVAGSIQSPDTVGRVASFNQKQVQGNSENSC